MLHVKHFPTEIDLKISEKGYLLYLKAVWCMKEDQQWVARETDMQTKSLLKLSINFSFKKIDMPLILYINQV